MADGGIRSEARSGKSGRARRGADEDDGSRARRRWGDEEGSAPQKKSSTLMWVLLGGGGYLLLLLLTCGGIFGFVYYKAHQVAQNLREDVEAAQQNAFEPNPRGGDRQGNRKRPDEYDSLDDALADLKAGDANRCRSAADWLARAKVEPLRQAEVAQKL